MRVQALCQDADRNQRTSIGVTEVHEVQEKMKAMENKVKLEPLHHRGRENIGIYGHYDAVVNKLISQLPLAKWSVTKKCWYVPLSRKSYEAICIALKTKAGLDTGELRKYLEGRNLAATIVRAMPSAANARRLPTAPVWQLSVENLAALKRFIEQLKLKSYSASTIRTYRNEFLQLLKLLKHTAVDSLQTTDIRRYMVYAMEKEGIKENTAHSRLNALKFYFEQVLGREKFFFDIPRPKKPGLLPGVFSQSDVAAIINCLSNKKHKAMVMLAYGAGLRVSEVVSLKTYQVDSKRMTIFIHSAKGKKDRIVGLSPVLLVVLREYAKEYQPDVRGYLFEGSIKGRPYSVRSLQEVLQSAKRKAGIIKPGSMHSLRHSFATHLVERGTDISMIQKLLGHNNIKTTLIYLHTSNKDLVKIISPLDDLNLR